MDHLYPSVAKVQRMQLRVIEGRTAEHDWVDQVGVLGGFKCRLDLTFIRPGKDVLPAQEAGVARDRVGVLFCSSRVPLQAGDRLVLTKGPIQGTFDIKNIPDKAQSYAAAHHIEVQVVETNQTLTGPTNFPSQDGPPEPTPLIED
jgi:hypothetical protein